MENPIKMDDMGGTTISGNTQILHHLRLIVVSPTTYMFFFYVPNVVSRISSINRILGTFEPIEYTLGGLSSQ